MILKIKNTCPGDILPIFLIKMLFNYFDKKEKNKTIKKKSTQKIIKINDKKEKEIKENKKISPLVKSNSVENTNTNTQNEMPEINDNNNNGIKLLTNSPIKTNIIPVTIEPKKENNNVIDLIKEEVPSISPTKIKERRNMSIGSHYNKSENGLIYRYQVYKLDGKGNAIFKCYDEKCSGEGIYDLNSKIFKVIQEHDMKHQEHDYILQCDKNDEKVFQEMDDSNKKDAQVFKEGNERTIKMY